MLGDGFLGLPHTVEALRGRRRRRDDTQRGRGSRPQVAKMPLLPSMLTSWKSDVVGAMKWMRDIPARTAVCTAAVIECDLPAPRPPRNSQHHDRSGGGSCASRAAKTQSSAASSPSPRISSSASSGVISLMSWRNWCMRLTSRKNRSTIVVVLFTTSPSMSRSFLPLILSTSARIFSVVSNTVLAAAAELERHMIGERTRHGLAAAKARGVKLGNPEQAKINRAEGAARALRPHIEQCHRNRSQRARHRGTEWRANGFRCRFVGSASVSAYDRPGGFGTRA